MGLPIPKITASASAHSWSTPDLSKHDQLMSLLETYHRVHIDATEGWENYGDTLSWCLEHCKGKFRDIRNINGVDWYFEYEEDATLFALRWS